MSQGAMLSDIVTNIGSIDIVLGEVDRIEVGSETDYRDW